MFKTKKEAVEWLDKYLDRSDNGKFWYEGGIYVFRDGEVERPDYKPVRYKDGWKIKALYYFQSTCWNAPQDGPVNGWWMRDIEHDAAEREYWAKVR